MMLLLALAVRVVLDPHLGDRHPFTTFYAAVTIAAWFGGFGPALMASLLGWIIADWWFTAPRFSFGVHSVPDLVGVITFLFVGVAVASFSGAMRSARLRAESAAEELAGYSNSLEALVRQRTFELRQSYERLRASERMAMVGMLSAGIGHDLGNMLFICRANLDAIKARSSVTADNVQAIHRVLTYLDNLVGNLRALSAGTAPQSQPGQTSLSAWWIETEPLLKAALPSGVELRSELLSCLTEVKIDPSSLSQIVFNLVHNAGAALRGRPEGWVRVAADIDAESRSVLLRVSDNGPGMSAEVKRQCTNPFFTTGAHPNSSGLGLAVVRHLVEQASGTLKIESEPGGGAHFTIRLPQA